MNDRRNRGIETPPCCPGPGAGPRGQASNADAGRRRYAGEGEAEADVNPSFSLEELDEPESCLSLLCYFDLPSIREGSGARPGRAFRAGRSGG